MSVTEFVEDVRTVSGVRTAYVSDDGKQAVVEFHGEPHDYTSVLREMKLEHGVAQTAPRDKDADHWTRDGMPILYYEFSNKCMSD